MFAAQPVRGVFERERDRVRGLDAEPREEILEKALRAFRGRAALELAQLGGELRPGGAVRLHSITHSRGDTLDVACAETHQEGPCTRNVENCQTSSSAGRGRAKPTKGSDQRSSGVQSDRCDAIGPRYGRAAARISSYGRSSGTRTPRRGFAISH